MRIASRSSAFAPASDEIPIIWRKARLGDRAAKVPTRRLPDWTARLLAHLSPQMRELLPLLGRTQAFSSEKARRLLGFSPRPPADTVAECATSLAA